MAGIIVLFEVDQAQAESPEGEAPAVLLVHAAGQDPEVPEDPLPRTLCGEDTESMEHSHYRPGRPGEPWYPPELEDRRCRLCEAALRRL
ncbi:hypothetical protein ABZW30_46305 [Kitasatospora sp. NPDC004669]|uniref:hypothetical protein n=1 Tax=Kitasatospora sp. NPDC004669 TaxID=3154555 RepID=UPI0033AB7DA6